MSWEATFLGGPTDGEQRVFVGYLPRQLYLYPVGDPFGWSVVGIDSDEPDQPWPGQVLYVRRGEQPLFEFEREWP